MKLLTSLAAVVASVLILGFSHAVQAVPVPASGAGTITADWAGTPAITYSVSEESGVYTYDYAFSAAATSDTKIKHFSLEVSDDFTSDDILAGTTGVPVGPENIGASAGNPGLPAGFFGLEWDDVEASVVNDVLTLEFRVVTDHLPKIGTFYVTGSEGKGRNKEDVYAYTSDIYVPGMQQPTVPEPAVLLLMGSGLLGLALVQRRRRYLDA